MAKYRVSQKYIGPRILEKSQMYILTRVNLFYTVCYEIPCTTGCSCLDSFILGHAPSAPGVVVLLVASRASVWFPSWHDWSDEGSSGERWYVLHPSCGGCPMQCSRMVSGWSTHWALQSLLVAKRYGNVTPVMKSQRITRIQLDLDKSFI